MAPNLSITIYSHMNLLFISTVVLMVYYLAKSPTLNSILWTNVPLFPSEDLKVEFDPV